MSAGIDSNGQVWGYFDVMDWFRSVLLSFPTPWSIAPLGGGKYYGTVVRDATGIDVLSFWSSQGEPSSREKKYFGNWNEADWSEYCCDCHWESEVSLRMAEKSVAWAAAEKDNFSSDNSVPEMILRNARWQDDVYALIQCGGLRRRNIVPSKW